MSKVIMICGTRTNKLQNRVAIDTFIKSKIYHDIIVKNKGISIKVIEGGAKSGADQITKMLCQDLHIDHQSYPPNFSNGYDVNEYFKRNHQMVDLAGEIWAFWDGQSHGTKDVISYATKTKKPLNVILLHNEQVVDDEK